MKPKYTPGPWRWINITEHGTILAAQEGRWVLNVVEISGDKEANMALVAAAPDLYAALVAAMDYISNGYQPPDLILQARAALDKAEGIKS